MPPDANRCLETLQDALQAVLAQRALRAPLMVGILTGGDWVARRLHQALGLASPLGTLDISFHRDDSHVVGLHPQVRPTHLPWSIDGAHLILVDDVLYTGRTVRAALNALFDWGRPASITLAVLLTRDGRELPVQADASGGEFQVPGGRQVKLRGPDPLRFELQEASRGA